MERLLTGRIDRKNVADARQRLRTTRGSPAERTYTPGQLSSSRGELRPPQEDEDAAGDVFEAVFQNILDLPPIEGNYVPPPAQGELLAEE